MFKTILLGVDGSDHALKAARLAGELARVHQSSIVWVVTCYMMVPSYMGAPYFDTLIAEHQREAELILQPAIQEIGSIPGELRHEILEGTPAEAILAVAEARNVDLIVMGTRGLGSLTGLLLGSQSQKVIAHAKCPVLVTR